MNTFMYASDTHTYTHRNMHTLTQTHRQGLFSPKYTQTYTLTHTQTYTHKHEKHATKSIHKITHKHTTHIHTHTLLTRTNKSSAKHLSRACVYVCAWMYVCLRPDPLSPIYTQTHTHTSIVFVERFTSCICVNTKYTHIHTHIYTNCKRRVF